MSEVAKYIDGPWYRDKYEQLRCANGEVLFRGLAILASGAPEKIAQAEANTRLIGLAPEMLKLLKSVSAALYIDDFGNWALKTDFHADGIDEIIAKATGNA